METFVLLHFFPFSYQLVVFLSNRILHHLTSLVAYLATPCGAYEMNCFFANQAGNRMRAAILSL